MLGIAPSAITPNGSEIAIMRYMRWSWSELNETPFTVVAEIAERMRAENHWRAKKAEMDKLAGR